MTTETPTTIDVITRESDDMSRSGRLELVSKTLDVGVLRERFTQFIAGIQAIADLEGAESSPFRLAEIQFSAEISAEGEFKLIGSGVGVQATSAVTFVLQRKVVE